MTRHWSDGTPMTRREEIDMADTASDMPSDYFSGLIVFVFIAAVIAVGIFFYVPWVLHAR